MCTNTPAGSFTCTCNAGYSGDGTTCTGKKPLFTTVSLFKHFQLDMRLDVRITQFKKTYACAFNECHSIKFRSYLLRKRVTKDTPIIKNKHAIVTRILKL